MRFVFKFATDPYIRPGFEEVATACGLTITKISPDEATNGRWALYVVEGCDRESVKNFIFDVRVLYKGSAQLREIIQQSDSDIFEEGANAYPKNFR